MTPEDLRMTKENYDEICVLKKKMCTVVKTVVQLGKLDNKLQGNICAARTIEELEHIVSIFTIDYDLFYVTILPFQYAPFKPVSKGSFAERAKKCGLGEPAQQLLSNTNIVNPSDYVNPDVDEIKSPEEVEKGIIHIMASEMATDMELLTFLREL